MKFRYFKDDETAEPLKSIRENWHQLREIRNGKLQAIFDSMPFYNGWYGDESFISGIVCEPDNPALKQAEKEKGYKIERFKGKYLIRPDRRYRAGKALDKQLDAIRIILGESPEFSKYALKKLGLSRMVGEGTTLYFSVCGVVGNTFIAKIPVGEEDVDKFPVIPDCLTEIKQSEFLAIQGE